MVVTGLVAVDVLGPLRLVVAGVEVPIAGRRERRVLALLAVAAGRVVSASALMASIWGPEPPRTANKALQTAVANLRRTLRTASEEAAEAIETVGDGYRLDLPGESVDVDRFHGLVRQAREQFAVAPVDAASLLTQALALWRGDESADLGPGVDAEIERHRLDESRLAALADRLDADVRAGRHRDVLGELAAACVRWPLRERFHELHMLALYRSGRQAEALDAFQRLRTILASELGLDPGPSARELEGRILAQDPDLAPPVAGFQLRARDLVGRDEVLGVVRSRLEGHSLVTLVGPGGVGKTSLATSVGAAVRDRDVLWCGLSAVTSATDVAAAVATAVGVIQRSDVPLLVAIRDRLAARPALLVMDNCEHVLEAATALTRTLLDTCPALTVLATSRERLGLPGEVVWPIEPLDNPRPGTAAADSSAVQLFVRRAQASDPSFTLGPHNLASVTALCLAVDGLPLAIELAAARVRALDVADIVTHMERGAALDGRDDRGADRAPEAATRHRDLRSMVAWSYDLLPERHRRVFRRLAHLAGSFDLDGAAAVATALGDVDEPEIAGFIADLVDKSMVVVTRNEDRHRYHLLETLRAFGREALDRAGEAAAVEAAAVTFLRGSIPVLAGESATAREAEVAAMLDATWANLRQAVQSAQRADDFDALTDLVGGLYGWAFFRVSWEITSWAVDAVARAVALGAFDVRRHGLLAATAAHGLWYGGDIAGGEHLLASVTDGAATADLPVEIRITTSTILLFRQDPVGPEHVAATARTLLAAGRSSAASLQLGVESLMLGYAGDGEAAMARIRQAERAALRSGSPSAVAWVRYCQSEVLGERDPAQAMALATEAADLAATARAHVIENVARIRAVTLASRHGEVASTLDEFELLLDRFVGDAAWTHVLLMIWNLVEALARTPLLVELGVILHVAPPGIPRPYGEQLERLLAVGERLAEQLTPTALREAISLGVSLDRDGAVAEARRLVAAARAQSLAR